LIDEETAAEIFEAEMKEMKKLKRQFVKELRNMIEAEVVKEKQRR
jgi:hypothetical protein